MLHSSQLNQESELYPMVTLLQVAQLPVEPRMRAKPYYRQHILLIYAWSLSNIKIHLVQT